MKTTSKITEIDSENEEEIEEEVEEEVEEEFEIEEDEEEEDENNGNLDNDNEIPDIDIIEFDEKGFGDLATLGEPRKGNSHPEKAKDLINLNLSISLKN
jgi:hypothetical protein